MPVVALLPFLSSLFGVASANAIIAGLVSVCGVAATTTTVATAAAVTTKATAVTLTAAEAAALASFAKAGNLGAAILLTKPAAICSAAELVAKAAIRAALKV